MAQRVPAWIAHAGLGISRQGGAPTVQTLADCMRLRVDRVELDICATSDGRLILRHDSRMPDGQGVENVRLAELRWHEPWLLTLDEALEHLGSLPLLLDVKTLAAAFALARWMRGRCARARFAVCTEILVTLLVLRDLAPRLAASWAGRCSTWAPVPTTGACGSAVCPGASCCPSGSTTSPARSTPPRSASTIGWSPPS